MACALPSFTRPKCQRAIAAVSFSTYSPILGIAAIAFRSGMTQANKGHAFFWTLNIEKYLSQGSTFSESALICSATPASPAKPAIADKPIRIP